MKEGRKLLFFDIDGTIWDYKNRIPDSTREAIDIARARGHLVFINSGRSRGYIINPSLFELGLDGIVSGCGSLVEYRGQVIFESRMDKDLALRAVSGVRRYGMRPVLEGRYNLYMDDEEFPDDWYADKLRRELGNKMLAIKDNWGEWNIQKISCDYGGGDIKGCMQEFGGEFDFIIHNLTVVEMVPYGISKGTGIKEVCSYLGASLADTVAFGDSINDRTMLETAGISVVMGNGTDVVKAMADHITTPLEEDGIWNACKELGII